MWQLKEDRNGLSRYLDELELDSEVKEQIVNYPSKQLSNAEFIIQFINEVGKNYETHKALNDDSGLPTGNWIHTFQSFNDVIDVLNAQVFLGQPIESIALKNLLSKELTEILRNCLIKFKELVVSPEITIMNFYKEHDIHINIMDNPVVSVNTKRWSLISSLSIHLLSVRLHTLIMPTALSSTAFINYDFETNTMKEEDAYEALFLLNEEIREFNRCNTSETLQVVFENSRLHKSYEDEYIDIETTKLLSLLHLFKRWINIIKLSKAIILYLNGDKFIMPQLEKKSPIPEMNEELKKEMVTLKEVNEFISNEDIM